jgi:hypothetical protein
MKPARTLALMALAAFALASCAGKREPVIETRTVEVRVPVTVPCLGEKPATITALIDSIPRPEWDALPTDTRANLLAAQALERKLYGEKLADAAAGCR